MATTQGGTSMGDPASTRWNERYGLLFHTFDHESDRGCVLMGAALIDEALERLLRSVCRADAQATKAVDALLVGAFAPLGSFASRAQAAFAFGLLSSEMFQLVTKLRKVRNRVAHGYEYRDFQSPDMKSYLEDLFATSGMVEKSGDRRV